VSKRKNLSPERSLRRGRPQRTPRARYLIVCEGKRTEKEYFDKYVRGMLQDSLMAIDMDDAQGNPLTLVEYAAKLKKRAEADARKTSDSYLKYDHVWAVSDVDEHPKLPEARAAASRDGVKLAVTNPCFELWGLLHLTGWTANISVDAIGVKLSSEMPGCGGKNKVFQYEQIKGRFSIAQDRATKLLDMHLGNDSPAGANPSTDVHLLVQSLIDEARKFSDPGPDGLYGL
jgi:hypothetical protein